MDSVFFSVKRAFHATLRYGRRVMRRVGLTPARFDLLLALTENPVEAKTQIWLRKMLGVARASISEMLTELERLGWVERSRHPQDRRTWRVALTPAGRDLVERAYDVALASGEVPLTVDYAIGGGSFEDDDVYEARHALEGITFRLRRFFGDTAAAEMYPWMTDDIGGLIHVSPDSDEIVSCEAPHDPVDLPLLEQP